MTSDEKQLLTLAAKALDRQVHFEWESNNSGEAISLREWEVCYIENGNQYGLFDTWNPIESSSDALELAVELRIHLEFDEVCVIPSTDSYAFASVRYNGDKFAATRLAIVNTAARLGEMKA